MPPPRAPRAATPPTTPGRAAPPGEGAEGGHDLHERGPRNHVRVLFGDPRLVRGNVGNQASKNPQPVGRGKEDGGDDEQQQQRDDRDLNLLERPIAAQVGYGCGYYDQPDRPHLGVAQPNLLEGGAQRYRQTGRQGGGRGGGEGPDQE